MSYSHTPHSQNPSPQNPSPWPVPTSPQLPEVNHQPGLEAVMPGQGIYYSPAEKVQHHAYYQQHHDSAYSPSAATAVPDSSTYGAPAYNRPAYGVHVNEDGDKEKTICGLRKITFLLVLVSVILLIGVIAAASAAGVAVSKANSNNAAAVSGPTSQSPQAPGAQTTTSQAPQGTQNPGGQALATTTVTLGSLPTFVAPATLGAFKAQCPVTSANATYIVPGTKKTFVRSCDGFNYPDKDLGRIPLTNMEDCMNLCAMQSISPQSTLGGCVGVVLLYDGAQGTGANFCWLKYTKPTPDTGFKGNIESAWLVS